MIASFADVIIIIFALCCLFIFTLIICRFIELFYILFYYCLSPCFCPNRRRNFWLIDLLNCLGYINIKIGNYCNNYCYKYYCVFIERFIICKRKCKLCKINIIKKVNKKKIKPLVYDNVHIIVVNPYDKKHQIATVSKIINT